MMENLDLSGIKPESKAWLWERLVKFTEFFIIHRDRDRDGIVEYQNIVETGWEDAPYFNVGFPCACPGLNASLALQMEAVAKLGREIGRPEEEYKLWMDRSNELIKKIVEKFWDGERWFAFNAETGKKSDSRTISLYTALFLGKRLPQEIIDKSIAFMYGPDGFNTPYGLASEGLTSKYFKHGFTCGSIITPAQFLMVLSRGLRPQRSCKRRSE
jgi:glycogen debranching enzyme